MKRRKRPPKKALKTAFHEVYHNEPEVAGQTRAKKGVDAAREQMIAIAMSKARRRSNRRGLL